MTDLGFCPQCGAPRQGSLRYCANCAFDFSIAASEGLEPKQQPETPPPPATPGPTLRSSRPWLLWVGAAIAGILVVGAIVVVMGGSQPGVGSPVASGSHDSSDSSTDA